MKEEAIDDIEYAIGHAFDEVHDYAYFFPYLNNRRDHFYDTAEGRVPLRRDPAARGA